MNRSVAKTTAMIGALVVAAIFAVGVGLLIFINIKYAQHQFRDLGIVFGAAVAATGAITAAYIAFRAGHHLELEKDRRERLRKIDEERTRTEAALVSLYLVATRLDELHSQIKDLLERAESALTKKNFNDFRQFVSSLPLIPNPFPLINDLDIRFMRIREQHAVRSLEVSLVLLRNSIESLQKTVRIERSEREAILADLGEDNFYYVLNAGIEHIHRSANTLNEDIKHYRNARGSDVIPDESKLLMLLGDLSGNEVHITNLDEAKEEIRKVASKLIREDVEAKDVRRLLFEVAESTKD